MIVKLLTEYHLECLSVKGGCTGSSESTLVKMSNCWISHAMGHIISMISAFLRICIRNAYLLLSYIFISSRKCMLLSKKRVR